MDSSVEQRRSEADRRLREAWQQGRIDATEHERRATALRHATTVDDIAAVERGDLRSSATTGSAGGAVISPIPPIEERAVATPAGSAVTPGDPGGVLSPRASAAIADSVQYVATIGFFVCGFALDGWAWAWLWWMLIPLVHTLLPAVTRGDTAALAQRRGRRRELKQARRRATGQLGSGRE